MPKELELADKMDEGNRAIQYWLQGYPPTTIAKKMGIKRTQVLEYVSHWQEIAHNQTEIKDRAKEALSAADQHYDLIIKELWESVNDIADTDHRTKGTLLKNLADIDAKRIEMLQKAGLLDDGELGDELAEMERKQEIIKGILRDVVLKCPNCKTEVARRMNNMDPNVSQPISVAITRTDAPE